MLTIKNIVNLTGHDVVVFQEATGKPGARLELTDQGELEVLASFPPQGSPRHLEIREESGVIRLVNDSSELEIPSGVESYTGRLLNLPDPEQGTLFIVSRISASASTRHDLVFPAREVRRHGIVVGCRSLAFPRSMPTTVQ
ncbi:MAG: hypothetical protein PUK59_02395 [Actinomycetaceae bacterium]|nr:hypothetical protein [Actinomycetaceae bacterium]